MGHGRWEDTGNAYFAVSSNNAALTNNPRDYFTRVSIQKTLDPLNITQRESCDSAENPQSNAIILGLDVTGSMGSIAHEMAKEGLGKLINGILQKKPVTDPHILISAIGDVAYDISPLQVSQFEADDRIVKELEDIYLEGGGGGNETESYDLVWYFAGTKTSIDCWNKRGKKGYIFTVGDEMPPSGVTQEELKAVFANTNIQVGRYSASELLNLAQQKYHVFHLIVEQGHYAITKKDRVTGAWKELLGSRALPLKNYKYMPEVILASMELSEAGVDADIENIVDSYDSNAQDTIRHAFGM